MAVTQEQRNKVRTVVIDELERLRREIMDDLDANAAQYKQGRNLHVSTVIDGSKLKQILSA